MLLLSVCFRCTQSLYKHDLSDVVDCAPAQLHSVSLYSSYRSSMLLLVLSDGIGRDRWSGRVAEFKALGNIQQRVGDSIFCFQNDISAACDTAYQQLSDSATSSLRLASTTTCAVSTIPSILSALSDEICF